MGKIDELIRQYCPDGVEYVKLGEILGVNRGKRLTKTQLSEDGQYYVYHGSKDTPLGKYTKFNVKGNTTIVVNTGGIGGVKFCADDFWCSDGSFWIGHSELLNDKYVYYFLSPLESFFASQKRVGGVPTIDRSVVENVEIPVPPLPVQEEIVKILDRFAEYAAELQAELQARQQQYNYYRDTLLSFEGRDDVQWMKLGDLCSLITKQTGFDYSNHIKDKLIREKRPDCLPYVQTKFFTGRVFDFNTDYYIPSETAYKFPKIILDTKCILFYCWGKYWKYRII